MADYTKTEWISGDIVTADKLNNMESGIAGNADDIAANKAELESQATKDAEHDAELASQAAKDVEHDAAIATINLKLVNNDNTIAELQNTDQALQEAIDALDSSSSEHLSSLDDSVAALETRCETIESTAAAHTAASDAKFAELDATDASLAERVTANEAAIATNTSSIEALEAVDTTTNSEIELIKATLTATANSVSNIQNWVENHQDLYDNHIASSDATSADHETRITTNEGNIATLQSWVQTAEATASAHASENNTKFAELDATDAEIKSTMVTGISYVEGTGVLTLLGVNDTEIATVTISTAGTVLKAAELVEDGKLQLTWQLVDGSTTSMEVDLSDLIDIYTAGTGITVDGKEISVDTTWSDARYPVVSITSDNGRAYIQNEVTGGGTFYLHTDGTKSFIGVNDGGADGINGQIYSIDDTTKYGTRLNIFKNGIFYHPNKTSSDVNYVINDPNQELAVKGDVDAVEAKIPDMTGYATVEAMTAAITTATASCASIAAMESAIAAATADCATTKMLIDELAKIEENHDGFATTESVTEAIAEAVEAVEAKIPSLDGYATTEALEVTNTALSTLEASLPSTYCVATVTSDTGTSRIQNETTGSGPMYRHTDGTYSYVGVNNGGADGIGVQTYVKNNSTNVGTRINVYTKGAYYIPNKSNTDADYVADDAQFEIAVKGDLTELQTTIEEKIPSIEGLATTESVTEAIAAVKAEYEALITALTARIEALEAAADTSTGDPEGE